MNKFVLLVLTIASLSSGLVFAAKVKKEKEIITYQALDVQYNSASALSVAIQKQALEELYSKTAADDGVVYENCVHVGDKVYSVKSVLGSLRCSQMPNGFNCNPKITMDVNFFCEVTRFN